MVLDKRPQSQSVKPENPIKWIMSLVVAVKDEYVFQRTTVWSNTG